MDKSGVFKSIDHATPGESHIEHLALHQHSVDIDPLLFELRELRKMLSEKEVTITIHQAPIHITVPDVKIPDILFPEIHIPPVVIPELKLPDPAPVNITLPAMNPVIQVPEARHDVHFAPEIKPVVHLSENIDIRTLMTEMAEILKPPVIHLPEIKVPEVRLPEIRIPDIIMPTPVPTEVTVTLPDFPPWPEFKLPDLKPQDIQVSFGDFPDVQMPEVKISVPKASPLEIPWGKILGIQLVLWVLTLAAFWAFLHGHL